VCVRGGRGCSQPVQVLAGGSYNFCRFALLQPGQTSSSCSTSPATVAASNAGQTGFGLAPAVSFTQLEGFTIPAAITDSCTAACTPGADAAMSVQQQHLSMSLLSKQLQQHEQHWEPHCAWPGQQQQCSLHHQEHTQQFEGADLSEQAEEQLVNVPPMAAASGAAMAAATTNLTDDRLEQTASSGSSHCVLALPSIDAANVGLWWLSQPTAPSPASGMNSCRDNPNMQPHIILQQHKTQDRATHGLCMAVGLCQPQVGTRSSAVPVCS